jgi:hypothetical protein
MCLQECLAQVKRQLIEERMFSPKNETDRAVGSLEISTPDRQSHMKSRVQAMTSSASIPSFNILDEYDE